MSADLHQRVSFLPEIHRLLPQSPDAEQGVIGSFLLAPSEVGAICEEEGVLAGHFHLPSHSLIYDLILELYHDNEPIDFITLTQILRDRSQLDYVGGAAFITQLFMFLPTAANARYYIDIVKEKWILREFIKVHTEYAARGYDEQDNVPNLISGAVDAVMALVKLGEGRRINTRDMRQLMDRAMERLGKRVSGEWQIEMPTGIRALDKETLGFVAPMLTAIPGKPSSGKSSLALNIAEHLAIRCGKKVGIISLDDSDDQVADRLIQQFSRVNLFHIKRTGEIGFGEQDRLDAAAKTFSEARDRLFIRDDGGLTPAEIAATFTTWKTKHGLDIGIIDHIQLARGDGKTRGRTEEAEQVSRSLKPMAKKFEIPLIVLSQVTEDTKGNFSTKNSKALEEDANNVWTISRSEDSTDAWINISKQKDGPRNVNVPVTYHAHCTRFTDREEDSTQSEFLPVTGKKAGK